MAVRRTTLTAEAEDLSVLAAEAKRRGVSLARLLQEAVAEKAARIRGGQRPRVGIFGGGGGSIAAAMEEEHDAPAEADWRS